MKNKLATLVMFGSIVIGGLGIAKTANAHYQDHNTNHGHVCTAHTALSVRISPEVDYNGKPVGKVITSLKKGATVQIKASYYNWEYDQNWYEVRLGDSEMTGYVSGKYICF